MRICCLGDSLTEGDYGIPGKRGIANVHSENYPFFLAKLSGAEVKNYGSCGANPTSYLKLYDSGIYDVTGADVIIIMLGTNGGLDPEMDTDGNRHYLEIIHRCRLDAPDAVIYLCTPPHVTENPDLIGYGCAPQVDKADRFVRKLAGKERLPLIDVANCPSFSAEAEPVMQANDGVHFVEAGYKALAEFIFRNIQ